MRKPYREWTEAQRDSARRSKRAWDERNKEKVRCYARSWAQNNKERVRAQGKARYWRNPTRAREAAIAYYYRNIDKRRAAAQARYWQDPQGFNLLSRLKKYGLTKEEFEGLSSAVNGICPICGKNPATHVDHDHSTGIVRGLLCRLCNVGLGAFGDKLEVLRRAAAYLERNANQLNENNPQDDGRDTRGAQELGKRVSLSTWGKSLRDIRSLIHRRSETS